MNEKDTTGLGHALTRLATVLAPETLFEPNGGMAPGLCYLFDARPGRVLVGSLSIEAPAPDDISRTVEGYLRVAAEADMPARTRPPRVPNAIPVLGLRADLAQADGGAVLHFTWGGVELAFRLSATQREQCAAALAADRDAPASPNVSVRE